MKIKNIQKKFSFFSGLGSILDIWSTKDYKEFIDKRPLEERIEGHWKEAGRHLNNALGNFEKENQNAKTSKNTNSWDKYYR